MIRTIWGMALASSLVVQEANAQAVPQDLLEVFHVAQAEDPTLRAAQATLEVARQKAPEAFASLLPVLSLNGALNSTQANTQFTGTPMIARDAGARSWTLQMTYPLLRIGNLIANRQAMFVVLGAQAQFEQAQQDLIVRVAQAYFEIKKAEDAVSAADAQVAALNEQLAQVTQGRKMGTKSMTDVDDTMTRVGSARAQRLATQSDLETARADLARITGTVMVSLAPLRSELVLPRPSPMESSTWIDQARGNEPAVRAQEAAVHAARLDVDHALSEHLPTVDLVANSVHDYTNHSLSTPQDYATKGVQHQFGIQVSVPLFAGGAGIARVSQARGNVSKAEADLEAARRNAAFDAQRAFAGVLNGLAQVEALEIAVRSGLNAVKGNQAGFRVGVVANVDVLNAEQQLFAAQRDLSKARYEVLLQGIKLKAAAGILNESDLQALNGLFH